MERIDVLLAQSQVQRRLGNARGAVDLAQRALAIDPDHARAHAFLSLALLATKRLAGALIEARLAVTLDIDDEFAHRTLALALRAARELDEAWEHALVAIGRPDAVVEGYTVAAELAMLRREPARARELIDAGFALDADHAGLWTLLARLDLDKGDRAAAQRAIERALQSDPADADAQVVAGFVALSGGDLARAEEHARFALNQQGDHDDALRLWVAIQARRSKLLGTWWRWSVWVSQGSESRRIGILLAMFVATRVAIILLEGHDHPRAALALRVAWLGFVAYTWVAPALFRRMLRRSLGAVALNPDY